MGYVNSGAQNTGTSGAATAALPGSRTNGNTLFAHVHVTGGAVGFSISTTGWTIIDQLNQGSGNDACVAWRVVDGSETDPVFSNDLTTWSCQVHQYSGLTSSPIGNKTKASGTSSPLAVGAVTTSADGSIVAGFLSASQNGVIPTPTSYTSRAHNEVASFSDILADETVASSGTPSDAVSVSITAVPWGGFLIELLVNDPLKHATSRLSGSAALAASMLQIFAGHATLAGAGSIAVDALMPNQNSASLIGSGALAADSVQRWTISATWSAQATLAVDTTAGKLIPAGAGMLLGM